MDAQTRVERAAEFGQPTELAAALVQLGRAQAEQAHHIEAAEAFEAAAGHAAQARVAALQAEALANAGVSRHLAGQSEVGLARSRHAAALFAELGDELARSRVEANCAVIHRQLGALGAATAAAARAEPRPELAANPRASLDAMQSAHDTTASADDTTASAHDAATSAHDAATSAHDRAEVALVEVLALQSDLAAARGDHDGARRQAGAALEAARRSGDALLIGRQLERVASLHVEQLGAAAALPDCFAAFTHYRAVGDEPGLYRATLQLAVVYQHLGRWPEAQRALLDARTLALRLDALIDLPLLAASVAATHLAMGRFAAALTEAQAAATGYRAAGDRVGLGRCLATVGQCLHATGDLDGAGHAWASARELLAEGDPDGAAAVAGLLTGT